MQQLITFLLFKIKKRSTAKVFRDKRSTKIYINIFYTYRGYQDIDFITKFFPKMLQNVVKKLRVNILFT